MLQTTDRSAVFELPLPRLHEDWRRRAGQLSHGLFLVSLAATVCVLASVWWFFLTQQGYVDYVEGLVLFHQTQAAAGANVYDPSFRQAPPHSIPLYGPVFYYLVAPFLGSEPSLLPGRLVSMSALLTLSAVSWVTLRRRFALPACLCALGAVTWLIGPGVLEFGANNRTDSLAVVFGALALLAATRPGTRNWAAAIPLLLLAGFTKPTAAVCPALAIAIWLASQRRVRETLVFSAVTLISALGILIAGDLLSEGNFSRCLVFSNANPLIYHNLKSITSSVCKSVFLPVGIAVSLGLLRDVRTRPFALHAGLAFLVAVATSAKVGANINYFIEPCWAAGFCLALALNRWAKAGHVSLAVAIAGALMLHGAARQSREARWHHERIESWPRLLSVLGRYGEEGPVLSLEAGAQAILGQSPLVADPHIVTRLEEASRFDAQDILRQLRSGRVAAVIAGEDIQPGHEGHTNWSDEVRRIVATRYRPAEEVGDLTVYVPRLKPLVTPVFAPEENGQVVEFYSNGRRAKETDFRHGLPHGRERRWTEEGVLIFEAQYADGHKHGVEKTWHENSQQASQKTYVRDQLEGVETTWRADGRKWTQVCYRQGVPHGPELRWDADGELLAQRRWRDGVLADPRLLQAQRRQSGGSKEPVRLR